MGTDYHDKHVQSSRYLNADKALDYKLHPCGRKDEPAFKRIAEVYHSDAVRELFNTVYKGVYIPAWE